MTGRGQPSSRAVWALGVPAVALYLVGLTLIVGQLRDPAVPAFEFWIEGTFSAPVILVIALVLVARRPDHRISQLFAALVVAGSVQTGVGAAATTLVHGGQRELGAYLAWAHDLAQLWLVLVLILIVLLFPTGRLPSRRWRPVGWSVVGGGLVAFVALALRPAPLENFAAVTNPVGLELPWLATLHDVGAAFVLAGFFGAVAATGLRFRRARGVERQQMKWFLFAVAAAASALMVVEPLLPDDQLVSALLWTIAPTGVVAVVGLAVLRYRLYEIDRLVSRTVSYVALTVLLVGIYVGGVLALGSLVRALTGGGSGDLVVAASTLAVAAAFGPLRRRIQAVVDRRFNRSRYDAQHTVELFGQRLRDEVDLDALHADLVRTVSTAIRPAHADVWTLDPGGAPGRDTPGQPVPTGSWPGR